MDVKIQETIEKLKSLALDGDSHENLSAICSVLYKPDYGWTIGACSSLREMLIDWLELFDPSEWSNEYLAEQGLMRLPVDADGEAIHIGDMMQWPDGVMFNVVGVGNGVFFYNDRDGAWCTSASDKTHYHKPTVEDVLREFVNVWIEADSEGDVFAEYAAKLRELMADE
jgi:hypothetical protein